MLLADFEAEVVKVEPPAGDRMKDHPGYLCWNRNKTRAVLDLHTYDGLREARDLLASADVAVFDALPGELERLGLDAATALADNPTLLHAWMPPYATKGRWSQLPPDDALLSAVTGVSHMQLSYEARPTWLVTPQASYGQAILAAATIGAGLVERQRSGRGQGLAVSGLNGVSAIESGGAIKAGEVFRLGGRSSRGGVPNYRLYRCADGEWLFLGTLTPAFFLKALEAMDLLDLMAIEGVEGEFTNLLRPPMAEVAIRRLDERFAEKPREEWLKILRENGVPRGPVGRREEWFTSETVAANGMRVALEHPKLGRVEMPGISAKLSETPGSVRHLLREEGGATTEKWSQRESAAVSAIARQRGEGGPLAGVVVLDLGAVIAGTFAPTILGYLGANVIKVEPPEGDVFRTYGLGFLGYNRGKRSLVIDLKQPDGRDAFLDLVRKADVVLDNYRLGVRERLGIAYADLAKVNPRIISCSVTGYGPVGPLANDPGFDPLIQAESGLMAAQGGADEPVFYQIPVNDTASAMMAVFGITAALHARERTGRGQEVLTCLANQSLICQSGEVTWYEGRPPNPEGGLDCIGLSALQRFYACANDEWLAISCTRPEQFQQVCIALGHPEWAGRFVAEHALAEPREGPLAALMAEALAGMRRTEALDRMLLRGVPAAPANRTDDVFVDPWLQQNRFTEEYDHPQFGEISGVAGYADFERTAAGFRDRAPLLGEHSVEVLREFGFAEARVEKLIRAGIVSQGG
jgi:crotonobetainyl-CoA:carnitine CoA-transferase CaiB-like acyl-CoA transferase